MRRRDELNPTSEASEEGSSLQPLTFPDPSSGVRGVLGQLARICWWLAWTLREEAPALPGRCPAWLWVGRAGALAEPQAGAGLVSGSRGSAVTGRGACSGRRCRDRTGVGWEATSPAPRLPL